MYCTTNAQNGFTIQAKFSGFPDGTKFYLEDPNTQVFIDSAVLSKNSIKLTGRLDETPQGLFLSTTVNKKYYWCFFFIGNENISIIGDEIDFPFYVSVKGSKFQDEYQLLNNQTRSFEKRRSELVEMVGPLMMDTTKEARSKWDSVWKVIMPIDKITDSIRIAFAKSHSNSYAGLNELYFLKGKFTKDSLQKIYNNLKVEYKESVYGTRIQNYLKVGDILKTGDSFSDFEAFDSFGNIHHLSASKGKYILLDFTETYCGPCIFSVDELKKVYYQYQEKLAIVSFCADKSKAIWQKGILRDKPSWLSLWDGKGLYGETVLKYGVTGYPTFFLIDPDGKIVWKNAGYGEGNIEEVLTKYIK